MVYNHLMFANYKSILCGDVTNIYNIYSTVVSNVFFLNHNKSQQLFRPESRFFLSKSEKKEKEKQVEHLTRLCARACVWTFSGKILLEIWFFFFDFGTLILGKDHIISQFTETNTPFLPMYLGKWLIKNRDIEMVG
jgi:hypothetical protein